LSRLAFPVIAWPLVELAVIYLLLRALKTQSRLMWLAAGVVAGLGVYSYTVYGLFAVGVATWVGYLLLFERSYRNWQTVRGVALMSVAAAIVALPLALYALDGSNDYFEHHQQQWLFSYQGEIEGAEPDASNFQLMKVRADWFFTGFTEHTQRDRVDGLGALRVIDRYTLVLLSVGVVVALWRWPRATSVLTALALAAIFVAVVTTYDGLYRRSFGMTPFIALIAAAPLAEAWRIGEQARPTIRAPLFGAVALVLALFVWSNIDLHRKSMTTEWMHWLYMPETVAAIEYMNDVEGDPYVYFYSDRISFKHDVRRYLADSREGTDRSLEFDPNGPALERMGGEPSLSPSKPGDALYVFIGKYTRLAANIEQRFPGGTRHEGRDDGGNLIFSTYHVTLPDE
jgi:hypothetical protein